MTKATTSVLFATAFAAALAVPAAAQQAQTAKPQQAPREEARKQNMRAYEELLRSDVRTRKVALITEMMQFTEAEDAAFWPIYRAYELELSRLNDDRLNAIEAYAKAYNQMTPAIADELAKKALDLEARRHTLKQNYYNKLKGAVSPITAAKALQVENQILLLIDLQVASYLPILK